MALDLQSAYDTVWRAGLLEKLSAMGVDWYIICWVQSFLEGRMARLVVGESAVEMATRDVRWPKFVGTGTERNAFPFKKDLSLSSFFSFFLFPKTGFPLFPIFLWISHPVFRRSFPVFSSFHLSKPVP